jgi:Kef-type K+ transport system membrane component KefB
VNVFLEFTIIVLLATIISIVMRLLKQPLVVGYIITGILISPHFLGLLHTKDYIELFSKIGITILLFIVGLNLSPRVIKEVGKVSFIGGLAQIVITAAIGFDIAILLHMPLIQSLYIAIALTFSSTIIILKLLSDKGDLQKLYGKISIGFLLVQDLVAIAILMLITSLTKVGAGDMSSTLILFAAKAIVLFAVLYGIARFVFPRAIMFLASSQELLFLFSITWGLGLASIFSILGFSTEVGALVAGVSLSLTPFADGIASRLKPLRDFFIVLFFVLLGSEMVLDTLPQIIVPALILSLFVLIGKPLIVFVLMNHLGFKNKPSFQVGIALAQVSEFSLILATLGLTSGQLDKQTVSLITLTALISIAGSSYLILSADVIYQWIEKYLKWFAFKQNTKVIGKDDKVSDLVLFGFDNVGHDFIEAFQKLEKNYVVVDLNPALIEQMQELSVPFKYGDAEDIEFLQELNLRDMKLCVSTIPGFEANALLIKKIREVNKSAIILVRSHEIEQTKKLYALGASYVIMPHYLGAKYATQMIARHGLDAKAFDEEREKHLVHVNRV